jgi:hypothetical protein
MTVFLATPALVVSSLRARAKGQEPHLPGATIDHFILQWIEGGEIPSISKQDYTRARAIRRQNNRRNAALRKSLPKGV